MYLARPKHIQLAWVALKPANRRMQCRDGFVFAGKGGD